MFWTCSGLSRMEVLLWYKSRKSWGAWGVVWYMCLEQSGEGGVEHQVQVDPWKGWEHHGWRSTCQRHICQCDQDAIMEEESVVFFGGMVCHGIPSDFHMSFLAMVTQFDSMCYSWYGLPFYAYLIHRTGTFIFPYSNLAMPLFPNGTPLFHIWYKHLCFYLWLTFIPIYMTPSLYLHTTRLYPLIRTTFVLCSISTHLYLPIEP